MERQIRGGSTSKVGITSQNLEIQEYAGKKSMEEVIAPTNEEK